MVFITVGKIQQLESKVYTMKEAMNYIGPVLGGFAVYQVAYGVGKMFFYMLH